MNGTMADVLVALRAPVAPVVLADPRDAAAAAARHRNAFKAFVYLFCIMTQVAEKTHAPAGSDILAVAAAAAGAKGKGRANPRGGKAGGKAAGKKSGAKAAETVIGEDDENEAGDNDGAGDSAAADEDAFDWPSFRHATLALLVQAVSVDFRKMWPMGLPEEVRASWQLAAGGARTVLPRVAMLCAPRRRTFRRRSSYPPSPRRRCGC